MSGSVSPVDGGTTDPDREARWFALSERWLRELATQRGANGKVAGYVLAEYDRRGVELDRLRAAVLAIADQLDDNLPGMFRSETANRLREALQSPTPAPTAPDRVGLEGAETPTAVCAKCGTAGCLEDAASGSYESDQEPS